jgi:hypothetical protein
MGRLIGGVVLGYLAMAFTLFIALTIAYVAMGDDRAFGAGVYEVTLLWAIVSLIVGFAAALLGGRVARSIAKRAAGPRWLAVIVFALGIGIAVVIALSEPGGTAARTDLVGPFEAMRAAQTPLWLALLNPLIGAVGVLMGGGALGRHEPVADRSTRL